MLIFFVARYHNHKQQETKSAILLSLRQTISVMSKTIKWHRLENANSYDVMNTNDKLILYPLRSH